MYHDVLLISNSNRNAIEEELEVLYDAYYDELEQYANYQQQYASSGGTLPPPPGPGPFPGSVELDKNGAVVGLPPPSNPRVRNKGAGRGGRRGKQVQQVQQQIVNGRRHVKGNVAMNEAEYDDPDAMHMHAHPDEEYDDEEYEEDEEGMVVHGHPPNVHHHHGHNHPHPHGRHRHPQQEYDEGLEDDEEEDEGEEVDDDEDDEEDEEGFDPTEDVINNMNNMNMNGNVNNLVDSNAQLQTDVNGHPAQMNNVNARGMQRGRRGGMPQGVGRGERQVNGKPRDDVWSFGTSLTVAGSSFLLAA